VGWFWYLVALAPVIGLVQIGEQAMADRYTYIPSIGVLILVCWTARDLGRRWQGAPVALAVAAAVVLVAFAIQTQRQVRYWRDNETLYRHAVRVTPDSYLAHLNLGRELVRQGRLEDASPHFERTLELRPDHELAHNNLGMVDLYGGRIERAVEHFERAVASAPDQAMYHANLAAALAANRRPDEAAEHVAGAVRLDPESTIAIEGLAAYLTTLGSNVFRRGHTESAETLLSGAVLVDPDLLSARIGLGQVLLSNARMEEALPHVRRAAELVADVDQGSPEHDRAVASQVHLRYGYVLAAVGEAGPAADQYREALRLQPGLPPATVGLAWLLATTEDDALRDPEEAAGLAAEACRASGNRDPKALDALAAADAARGRFEQAVVVAEKAIAAARASGRPALAEAIQRRMDGYRAGKPYTERAIAVDE
jgi:tetratricopeptide (TPR) repeat protein